ncbi:MFS general substrate transporter [Cristinia sonorae]|uniref:MFS general substrate transporter n=1 Tax=Cristinia sonorae TaxID=1940300 RepID=A0A8K0UWM3_9AGAR|nr:MFS general substrate transporter [Cristinia sonorae]
MIPPPPSSGTGTASAPLSPTTTLVDGRLPQNLSVARKYALLLIFCLAQFMDAVNNSALFPAIPIIMETFGITESESSWIISAFQLTFASFLLIIWLVSSADAFERQSGKISDVYNPKYAFITGFAVLGIFSLAAGFVKAKIALIVIRALSGIAASLTIPSALTLLVNVFPDPTEQARAIGVFGGCGAIGNISGIILGAIFVQYADWRWVFWFVALIAIPVAGLCVVLIPNPRSESRGLAGTSGYARWRSLDMVGVSILTAALILFIYAVTSGSTSGWGTAGILAPLIISIVMVFAFFFYETKIPASIAAVPPRTWFLPNFAVLFGVALLPYLWWVTSFTIFPTLWQSYYHWSAISVALRMIPMGVFAFAISFTGALSRFTSPKYILLPAQVLILTATILLRFGDAPDKYFSFILPGFILGTSGCMLTYTHANIAIFRTSPASMAGTVGAIYNGALQLGSAVGLAAVTSIQTSVEKTHGGPSSYAGRAAAFWFVFGIVSLELISIAVFYRVDAEKPEAVREKEISEPERKNEDSLDTPGCVTPVDEKKVEGVQMV